VFKSQTATNFNVNDCNGVNHDLFNELNSGKVIVLCWVMPCSTCEAPAKSAHDIVQSYSVSNPGQVLFYLCDDFGTTSCATLNNWAASKGLTNFTLFSSNQIKMSDYGSNGMPKLVVLGGGSTHTVYDNQNNTLNITTFSTAINTALANSPTGLAQNTIIPLKNSIAPNPVSNELNLSYYSASTGNVKMEIYNLIGEKVLTKSTFVVSGNNKVSINVSELAKGEYFLKLEQGTLSETLKFIIVE
jgi:hypothetical protein